MPSIWYLQILHDLDTFPGFFFFPEILGHQQIVGYHIPPFWLILETSTCNHFHFPTPMRNLKFLFLPAAIAIVFTRMKPRRRVGPPIATWTGRASTTVRTRGTRPRKSLLAGRESSRGGTSKGAWRGARSASWGTPGDWLGCTTCKALMSHFLLKWALSHPEPAHASHHPCDGFWFWFWFLWQVHVKRYI